MTRAPAGKAGLASPAFSGAPTAPTASTGIISTQVATTAFVQTAVSKRGTVGQIGYFHRTSPPTGWLKANGAAVSRITYATLFEEIGTTAGPGNGTTTFNVPDHRGLFPRGWGDARGLDTGRAMGTTQDWQNGAHTHSGTTGFQSASHSHGGSTSADGSHTHTPPFGEFSVNASASYAYGGGGSSLGLATKTAAAGAQKAARLPPRFATDT